MRAAINVFWLIGKEIRSTLGDPVMVVLILWSFFIAVMMEASGAGDTVHNAAIAIVDEDRSPLSRAIPAALTEPWFQPPVYLAADEAAAAMDRGEIMFALNFPPDLGADAIAGRRPVVQLLADATAVTQAQLGADYIRNIVADESRLFVTGDPEAPVPELQIDLRRAFNPNGDPVWFKAMSALLNQLSVLTIVLTGAAMLREREHGTIEHLMVMPLSPAEVALSKVLAVMVIVLVAFVGSLVVVVKGVLGVPVAGPMPLLLAGTALYLWAAAAIGMLLGTLARSMAQFALLIIMVIIPIIMLSGGFSAIESQPEAVQHLTFFLPSRHFLAFAKAVAFRGAGIEALWLPVAMMAALGAVFFAASLALFRRSMSVTG